MTLPAQGHRIVYLDGLRGVAILLVVFFHSYSRWPRLNPFGDRFMTTPILSDGWIGVQLFFMISGFVIALSLRGSDNFRGFLFRRWLRLFPAMLILSFVNYGGSFLFPHRPLGLPSLRDLLPGLTFLEPEFWALLIGKPRPLLELSFWTLYVEVKFYIIFGALYFWFGLNRAILGLIILFFTFCCAAGISILLGEYSWRDDVYFKIIMDMRHYGWFVVGILAFRYRETLDIRWFFGAVAMMLLSALALHGRNFDLKLPGLLIGAFFIATIWFPWIQRLLASRALVFVGAISYPLYLIHENTSVALAVEVGALFPRLPSILIPVGPIAVVMLIAWITVRWPEPWLRKRLRGVNIVRRRKTC